MQIGIDSFAYHRYFGEVTPWEQPLPSSRRWQTDDFLRRAEALGVQTVSLQTVYLPDQNPAPDRQAALQGAVRLRARLADFGLEPVLAWGHRSGLEAGTNPQKIASLLAWLEVAHALGCKIVRYVNSDQMWWAEPAKQRLLRLVPILREAAAEAARLGLTLAAENHADYAMHDLVRLVDAVGADNLSICFDSGNAVRVGDDLLDAVQTAGQRIRMVHLKDMALLEADRGNPNAWWPAMPLGRGKLDLPAFVGYLQSIGYDGGLYIEMANMYTDCPDEDAAVAESVTYLRGLLSSPSLRSSPR